jgi:hypothetical protein
MRLIPLTTDIIITSTALAGIRRASKIGNIFRFITDHFPIPVENAGFKWLISQFLLLGEVCLDLAVSVVVSNKERF